jgi:hypothetical protein
LEALKTSYEALETSYRALESNFEGDFSGFEEGLKSVKRVTANETRASRSRPTAGVGPDPLSVWVSSMLGCWVCRCESQADVGLWFAELLGCWVCRRGSLVCWVIGFRVFLVFFHFDLLLLVSF